VKCLSIPVFLLALLAFRWPNVFTVVPLVVLSFPLVGDIINIFYIRRKASKDPAYLETKV
jgi:hypothetical protein